MVHFVHIFVLCHASMNMEVNLDSEIFLYPKAFNLIVTKIVALFSGKIHKLSRKIKHFPGKYFNVSGHGERWGPGDNIRLHSWFEM